jgi:flagellar protein FliO/FliZ
MTYEALVLEKTPVVTFGYIVQVALSLAIVLGLIYLISRFLLPRLQMTGKSRLVEVLDRIGLEPQVTAYVIKFNKNIYLVACGQKGVALLDKFKEGDIIS